MKNIQLTQGKFAIVDNLDYELLNRLKWGVIKSNGIEYAATTINKSITLYMHQLISGCRIGHFSIHKNGNTLDNRRENLEYVNLNLRRHRGRILNKNKTSKYKGVFKNKYSFTLVVKYLLIIM